MPTSPRAAPMTDLIALRRLQDNVASVLLGKPETIRLALVALLAEGHLLIEDVPGIGKTLLAKALARCSVAPFTASSSRPTCCPATCSAPAFFTRAAAQFVFQPGPLFAQVVLADEINRATPRTQAALAGSDERTAGVDGRQTRPLGPPFFVLATQNPYEFEGTYPLPESQLDRFLMRLRIGYPDRAAEKAILTGHRAGEPVETSQAVLAAERGRTLQHDTRQVRVDDSLADYVLNLIAATRGHADIYLGASTRAALALYRAAQALALVEGRDYVVPDDVKQLAVPVLAHRLLLRSRADRRPATAQAEKLVEAVVRETALPG